MSCVLLTLRCFWSTPFNIFNDLISYKFLVVISLIRSKYFFLDSMSANGTNTLLCLCADWTRGWNATCHPRCLGFNDITNLHQSISLSKPSSDGLLIFLHFAKEFSQPDWEHWLLELEGKNKQRKQFLSLFVWPQSLQFPSSCLSPSATDPCFAKRPIVVHGCQISLSWHNDFVPHKGDLTCSAWLSLVCRLCFSRSKRNSASLLSPTSEDGAHFSTTAVQKQRLRQRCTLCVCLVVSLFVFCF